MRGRPCLLAAIASTTRERDRERDRETERQRDRERERERERERGRPHVPRWNTRRAIHARSQRRRLPRRDAPRRDPPRRVPPHKPCHRSESATYPIRVCCLSYPRLLPICRGTIRRDSVTWGFPPWGLPIQMDPPACSPSNRKIKCTHQNKWGVTDSNGSTKVFTQQSKNQMHASE